jgi:hypothetical protein
MRFADILVVLASRDRGARGLSTQRGILVYSIHCVC